MTFKAYIRNIEAKTGKPPGEFRSLATERGLMTNPSALPVVALLKQDFGPRHGHAMAIWCAF